jgi:plastocyanin
VHFLNGYFMTTTRRTFLARAAAAAPLPALAATTARAATHTVTIKNMAFSPANMTIAVGDTVTWVNEDRPRYSA